MFFARGLTTIVHTDPFNVQNEGFVDLRNARITIPGLGTTNRKGMYIDATIEIGVVIAIVIVLALFFMLRWSKLGRNFYAVGGNMQSALMMGINVKRTKFLSHLICSILAGIGGYVYFLHVGSGAASHAMGMEMNAIASSIIGGTMLTGGVGNIIGTLFGVLSLSTIQNIVSSAGFDQAWWTGITIAGMLCLFLLIQSVIMAKKKKALKSMNPYH
jgi:simple sugar transport system permease protein